MLDQQEIEKLWNNQDNQNIMSNVCKLYKINTIDQINDIKNISFMETCKRFDKNRKTKFTTFLHQNTVWQILKFKKEESKHKNIYANYRSKIYAPDLIQEIDLLDSIESLGENLSKIIHDRFFNNMTIKSIAQKYNTSTTRIRSRISLALKLLKDDLV